MKKLILIALIMFSTTIMAQRCEDIFTITFQTELADKNTHNDKFDYGVNIGAAIEYHMRLAYLNAEVFYFPDLNGITYFSVQGTLVGLNLYNRFKRMRYYVGVLKPGFINRGNSMHAMIGSDIGIEYHFNGMLVGLEGGYDYRTDSKIWGQEYHTVGYAAIKIGFRI